MLLSKFCLASAKFVFSGRMVNDTSAIPIFQIPYFHAQGHMAVGQFASVAYPLSTWFTSNLVVDLFFIHEEFSHVCAVLN